MTPHAGANPWHVKELLGHEDFRSLDAHANLTTSTARKRTGSTIRGCNRWTSHAMTRSIPPVTTRLRLYIETSFWNRLGDREHLDMRRDTYRFLNRACRRHDVLISPFVIDEVQQGPDPDERRVVERQMRGARPTIISGEQRARDMALALQESGRFTDRMLADLTHVAYAIMGNADALVTWDRRTLARDRVRLAASRTVDRKSCAGG